MLTYPKIARPAPNLDDPDLAHLAEIRNKLKKPGSSSSGRHIYRAGYAPTWTAEADVMDDDVSQKKPVIRTQPVKGPSRVAPTHIQSAAEAKATIERRRITATVIEDKTQTSTLSSPSTTPSTSASASASAPRRISTAVIVDATSLAVPEPEDEVSDDEVERRRQKARDRYKQREEEQQQEEEEQEEKRHTRRKDREEEEEEQEQQEEEEEEEEEDESSEESDDSADRRRMMIKPVFRSRKQRDTIAERQAMEEEELAAEEAARKRAKDRKQQSQAMVIADIKREEEEKEKNAEEAEMPDDRDDINEEEELDAWKLRELKRLKREKEERIARDAVDADLERRRHMSDAEIAADNARRGIKSSKDKKDSYRFLQRYYHAGAYFRQGEEGEDDVYQRDFTAPTGMDRTVDMSLLPKVLQVKKFGLKGRTKYTHLTDQDTTARDSNPWAQASSNYADPKAVVQPKRLAGTGPVDRPKHKK